MLDRLTDYWQKITIYAQTRWRWLGYVLILASFVYIGAIIIYNGQQLCEIPWRAYWIACLITLGLYLLSLLVQYFVWARMLSFHHHISLQDFIIYFKVLVLRRLPGGVWHWVGRTALYSETTHVPPRAILLANFLEWILLFLTACIIAVWGSSQITVYLKFPIAMIFLGVAIFMATRWKSKSKSAGVQFGESILWVSLYTVSWILGGLVILAFVKASGGGAVITWWEATWIWALTGGSSLLVIIVPTGLGIREIALVLLLQPQLQASEALIIAMLIRFTFSLADLLWGLVGLVLGQSIASRKKMSNPVR
jgi:hypothetical protein